MESEAHKVHPKPTTLQYEWTDRRICTRPERRTQRHVRPKATHTNINSYPRPLHVMAVGLPTSTFVTQPDDAMETTSLDAQTARAYE